MKNLIINIVTIHGVKISHIYNMKRNFFNLLILACAIQLVQGCALAGLGLLGGGGYYVGTKAGKREEERIKTKALIDVKRELESKDNQTKAQDQQITSQISQNYLAGALDQGIAVYPEVRNGVVILHGRVPDAATAERAIAAARRASGVQRIISNLVILNQQPAMPPVQQMPPQVPPQYQQQYQQFMQQYQQPQPPVQPAPVMQYQQPDQPIRIKYEQIFNYQRDMQKQMMAGEKAPIQNKSQAKRHQSPPGLSPPKGANAGNSSSSPKQVSKSSPSSPKILPEKIVDNYSDDNDSGYKEYYPKKISRNRSPQPKTVNVEKQKEVIFVPVPVPSYTEDYDNQYRGLGNYNPNPIRPYNQNQPVQQPEIPVPTPSETEDNDLQYYN